MSKFYLIDGVKHTKEQISQMFSGSKLGKREKATLSMLDNPKDDKTILDIGCLYGCFPIQVAEKYPCSEVIAGDYLDEHLEIAKIAYPKHTHIYRKLNVYDLALEDKSVDIVTFQEVIEHLEGAANSIKEINRVLKPGGELILSTPTAYYWKDAYQAFKYEFIRKFKKGPLPLSDSIYFKEHEWNRHIYCWTPSTLYTLLKVNGFEYVTHEYCQASQGFIEKVFLKIFPCASPTIIIKVKKVAEAPELLV